jgi:hypothetical protein
MAASAAFGLGSTHGALEAASPAMPDGATAARGPHARRKRGSRHATAARAAKEKGRDKAPRPSQCL